MRVVNFAHGTLMMLGMYTTYWAFSLLHIDPYLSILICIPILFAIGACIQRFLITPIIKAPEHNQLLLTLGVSLFLENLVVFLWSPDYRVTRPAYEFVYFYFGELSISLLKLLAFAAAMLVTLVIYLLLSRTDLGKAIRAASEEPHGALLMGINIRRIYWITFGIGAACAGVAGSVTAPFFPAYPTVGSIFVITAFMVVVLGGMGSVPGAFVGGLVIGVADSIGGLIFPGAMKTLISFVLFILILLFKPTGLLGGEK
jgi:branched-chain amino acid transport system permease protein